MDSSGRGVADRAALFLYLAGPEVLRVSRLLEALDNTASMTRYVRPDAPPGWFLVRTSCSHLPETLTALGTLSLRMAENAPVPLETPFGLQREKARVYLYSSDEIIQTWGKSSSSSMGGNSI